MRKNQQGFSLIELLIVVAIILIIAAIAVPNLLRSRMAANEASAVGSLRTMNTACATYAVTYGIGYPAALSNLAPVTGGGAPTSAAADLIDDVLSTSIKSGYSFALTGTPPAAGTVIQTYTATAEPVSLSHTGNRYFFTDQSGVIRQNVGTAAGPTDTPI
jgi:type IV pilus assembly protein PilA